MSTFSRMPRGAIGVSLLLLTLAACSGESGGFTSTLVTTKGVGGSSEAGSSNGGAAPSVAGGASSRTGGPELSLPTSGGATASQSVPDSVWPPPQCNGASTDGEIGAYCRGPVVKGDFVPTTGTGANQAVSCGTTVWGIVRDFHNYNTEVAESSPDFGNYCCDQTKGMVADVLGPDKKPVYTGVGESTKMMTSKADFDNWFRSVDGVNVPFYVAFRLVPSNASESGGGKSVFTFSAADTAHQYFPLDDQGFGNEYQSHNYSFTTEIHTQFLYEGSEVFTFAGDDDLWVFINNKLAIDLGGIHISTRASVDLDAQAAALGLEVGKIYSLDLFGAERRPGDSNFRIDTSLKFVDCGVAPPVML